jgi:hypothetical protein
MGLTTSGTPAVKTSRLAIHSKTLRRITRDFLPFKHKEQNNFHHLRNFPGYRLLIGPILARSMGVAVVLGAPVTRKQLRFRGARTSITPHTCTMGCDPIEQVRPANRMAAARVSGAARGWLDGECSCPTSAPSISRKSSTFSDLRGPCRHAGAS